MDKKLREEFRRDAAYVSLETVFAEAVHQASQGKGQVRHANDGERYEDQQVCEITRRLSHNPVAGALFQAIKKCYESARLPYPQAKAELLGAMNYIAAAVIVLDEMDRKNPAANKP